MSLSLDNLPDVDFAEKDTETIKTELIADFEKYSGRTLYPADPLRILLLSFAEYVTLLRNNIDLSAKQNLLKYADDNYIENIGALVGVERLQAQYATVTVRFTLSETQESTITIPKGTRVTCNNAIYFQTEENTDISTGTLYADVKCICLEVGTVGNDYYVGQINTLVDPISYIDNVSNITISSGGSDMETLENYRERILISSESFSVAGPKGAYIYLAKSASADIIDISVASPEAGVVEIIPLMKDGELPTTEILNKVKEICNDDEKRPLTDFVKVSSPQKKTYNINLTYYIDRENSTSATTIQNNIKAVVQEFILWQKNRLGRDINPSKLISNIIIAGAKRVDITEPNFQKINYNEIAVCESVNIIYGGLEDA